MGKEVLLLCRKTAAAVLGTAAVFCLGVMRMQTDTKIILTNAEKKLIEVIRSLDYGEVRVMIKDRHPIRVEEIRRSIQLPAEK